MLRATFSGVLWGVATWFILTFLMGSIWGMTHSPGGAIPLGLSSNVRNLILLPPSLLLAIVFVCRAQTLILKKSLISILVGLAIWWAVGVMAAIALGVSGVAHERARKSIHVLNPVLLGITIACSGYFIFPRLKR